MGEYLAKILFVPFGTWLAVRWFTAVTDLPSRWDNKVATTCEGFLATTHAAMSHWASYLLVLLAVTGTTYTMGHVYPNYVMPSNGGELVTVAFAVVWWYVICRTFEISVLVFWDVRRVLNKCNAADCLNLFDDANLFGLKPLLQSANRFTWLFIFMGGGYLMFYQFFFYFHHYPEAWDLLNPKTMALWCSIPIWIAYLGMLPFIEWTLSIPAKRLLHNHRDEQMHKLVEQMQECEKTGDRERFAEFERKMELYRRASFTKHPLLLRKALTQLSFLTLSLVPVLLDLAYFFNLQGD